MLRLKSVLFGGTSLLALSAGLLLETAPQAMAAACGSSISGASANCTWSSGDITITSTGTFSDGSTSQVIQSGTTGTLTNSGTITSVGGATNNGAINVSGTIGSIVNNAGGLIRDTNQGRAITATNASITSIANAGTMTGNWGIIYSGASNIGTITNSGLMSNTSAAGIGINNTQSTIGTIINSGTINTTQHGILNHDSGSQSSIGSIDNSGTITSSADAIHNRGTITSLNNSGKISGANGLVVAVNGTIVALTNSGTITGTGNAINIANGSIGTLTNSGVISGNITNTPANVLTINGGSGSTYGTLTGGVITSTSANVVFGSGNILLEDNVNVTGRTLANTGATVKLTTGTVPTITGTYNQTAGGILVTPASTTNYGWMKVTGNATVNNSTITISGTTMNIGDRYTIVKSGGVGTYTGDTAAVAGKGGLTASVITVGGTDLVVVLAAKDYGTITTSPATTPTLNKIATSTSAPATKFQTDVLSTLDNLPTDQQAQAVKQLEPSKNAPATQMAANAATVVLGAVEQHQQTVMAYDSAAGGAGKAAGSDIHDRAVWGEVLGGGAIRGSNAEADGYKTHNLGMAVGADQQFNKNAMAGVALSWMRSWSQGRDGSAGSNSTLDSYQLTLYGTYRLDRAFVDGQLAAGWNHFDQHRAIPFLGQTADATYDGQQYLAKATFGYDIPVTNATVTPLAGLRWLRAVHDGYTETGAGAANLEVDSSGVNYVSHDLGGKVSFSSPTDLGPLRTEVKLAWVHDYTHGAIPTTGLMGGETFASSTPRTKPDGARFGLAGTLNSDDDLSFRAEYEGELRQQYQSHAGLVKAIWGF